MYLPPVRGTKLSCVVRTILSLVRTTPTVKLLLFSEWPDVLFIIAQAFKQNQIGYQQLKTGAGKQARVSTENKQQATQTTSHHHRTIPYHTILYHTIPYHTVPYHTIPRYAPHYIACPIKIEPLVHPVASLAVCYVLSLLAAHDMFMVCFCSYFCFCSLFVWTSLVCLRFVVVRMYVYYSFLCVLVRMA